MKRTATTRHTRRANSHGIPARHLIDIANGVRKPRPSDGFVAALAKAYDDRTDTVRIPRIVLTASAAL